jgi:hypothetical protein
MQRRAKTDLARLCAFSRWDCHWAGVAGGSICL